MPISSANISTAKTYAKNHCLAVARSEAAFRVLTLQPIAAGDTLLVIDGEWVDRPSRFSVQVGIDKHVELPPQITLEQTIDHHSWRFLNHACDPNCMVRDQQLIAVRAIAAGEEVSFHYATTEWQMAEAFHCGCQSLFCLGEIRGFRFLDAASKERLRPLLAPYLLQENFTGAKGAAAL